MHHPTERVIHIKAMGVICMKKVGGGRRDNWVIIIFGGGGDNRYSVSPHTHIANIIKAFVTSIVDHWLEMRNSLMSPL